MEAWGPSQAFLLCFFKVSILVPHMADAVCLINETYQELLIIEKKKASLSTVLIKLIARDGLTGKCPPTSPSQANGIIPPRLESDSQDRRHVG